jgi:hypothetical protein
LEAAAVFCAFLAPFFALIAGLALVTFSAPKRVCRPKKLLSTGLIVGAILALGWAPILLSRTISVWLYVGVIGIIILYEMAVILFVSAYVLPEKMVDEPADKSLRAQIITTFRSRPSG